MPGMEPKKLALLRILAILEQYSDEKHPLTQEEILSRLDRDYGITLERKAVGRNLALLREAGYEIVSTGAGCYLSVRQFEDAELQLVMHTRFTDMASHTDPAAAVKSSLVYELPAGTVDDGSLQDMEQLETLLREALSRPEFKRLRRVVFTLSSTQVISEEASVPAQNGGRLEQLLRANMDVYFPVDPEEYNMVWQTVGAKGDGELTVRLWAVPRAMLLRYYNLANDCGLRVEAIDYCGHSAATAVGVSYALPAEKKAKAKVSVTGSEEEPAAEESAPRLLFLSAEQEHLILTFAQGRQVLFQRVLQRGIDWHSDMSEVLMSLEYFDTLYSGASQETTVVLCGSESAGPELAEAARQELELPLRLMQDSEWHLCRGACATTLDFGLTTMNSAAKASNKKLWQYIPVLLGAVAFDILSNKRNV